MNRGFRPVDVLCGKGPMSFHHAGNVRYREAILEHIGAYISARNHLDRDRVVQSIIDSITTTGGRFLHKVEGSTIWTEMPKFKCIYKVSHAIRDAVKFRLNRARNTSSSSNITKASNQIPTSTSQISNDRLSELDRMLEGFACPAPTDIKWAEDRWSSGNGNQLQKLEEDSSLINTGEEQTTSNHKVGNNIALSRVASIGCHDLSNTDFFNFNDRVNVNEWNSRSIKGDKHDGFTCTSDPNDLVEVKWCESKQQCDDDESFVKDIEEVLGPLQPDERIFYERLGSWESDDQ